MSQQNINDKTRELDAAELEIVAGGCCKRCPGGWSWYRDGDGKLVWYYKGCAGD